MGSNGLKNMVIGFLMGIIVILVVLAVLFGLGKIKFSGEVKNDSKSDVSNENQNDFLEKVDYNEIYLRFVRERGYYTDSVGQYDKVSYVVYDLNKDGVLELVVRFQDGSNEEWEYVSIYGYDQGKVVLVKALNAFHGMKYNMDTGEVVYTEVRNSGIVDGTTGNSYGCYKLNGLQLELSRMLGYSYHLESGTTTYFVDEKSVSADEYNRLRGAEITFDYIDVK